MLIPILILLTTVAVPQEPGQSASTGAAQVAAQCRIGCNIYLWGRCPTPEQEDAYRDRFAGVFDFATLPFYWWSYEREQGHTEAERISKIAAWCEAQGIATKGHPLLWNYADPPWLPADVEQIRELSLQRAEDCPREFAGRIDTWDVVNEATHFDREGLRGVKQTRMWKEAGTVPLLRAAFARARAANPGATLLINDYRTDEAYAQLIDSLRDEEGGFPFDVIGIQSHMHGGVWSDERIDQVCRRFARFGLPLHFTEVTIVSGPRPKPGGAWESTPEGEQRQAAELERFYRRLLAHPEVAAITWWDLSDHGAWQNAPAGLLRKDMSPKPAYHTLARLVQELAERRER